MILLIQLHSMNLVLYKHHIFIIALCCVSRTKPIREIPEDPSWKLMSKGERVNIKAYHLERDHIKEERVYHLLKGERDIISKRGRERPSRGRDPQKEREISREREYLSRKYFPRIPDAWCSRGDMPTCLIEGRDTFI